MAIAQFSIVPAGVICQSKMGSVVSARAARIQVPVRGPIAEGERDRMAFPEGRPRWRASVEEAASTPVDVIGPATSRVGSSLSSMGCRCCCCCPSTLLCSLASRCSTVVVVAVFAYELLGLWSSMWCVGSMTFWLRSGVLASPHARR